MSDLTVARRYAQALFELAREEDKLEVVQADLRRVVETILGNGELKNLLHHQLIRAKVKKEIFQRLFGGAVEPLVLNFLMILFEQRRESHLGEISRRFQELALLARGVMEVEVRSAVSLGGEDLEALRQSLASLTGKSVLLKERLEPALLGGVVVKVGDRIYDGSVRRRLKAVKDLLRQAELREIGVS